MFSARVLHESLAHVDFYVDDVISVLQSGAEHKHQVFNVRVCAIKWILPSLAVAPKE